MKPFRSVVLASVLVAVTGTAWALGGSVAGTVQKVDQQSRKLTLENGQSFSVASSVKIDNLQPGDKVNVTTDEAGKNVTRIEQTGTQSTGSSSMGSQSSSKATAPQAAPSAATPDY